MVLHHLLFLGLKLKMWLDHYLHWPKIWQTPKFDPIWSSFGPPDALWHFTHRWWHRAPSPRCFWGNRCHPWHSLSPKFLTTSSRSTLGHVSASRVSWLLPFPLASNTPNTWRLLHLASMLRLVSHQTELISMPNPRHRGFDPSLDRS